MEEDEDNDYNVRSTFDDFDKFYEMYHKYKKAHQYFQVLLSRDPRKTSYIWKYFGSLKYKNKIIFEKHNFCKLCLKPETEIVQDENIENRTLQPRCEPQPIFKR